MERAPASNRSRLASRMIWIGAAAWLAAVAGGFAFLLRYKSTPAAQSGAAPAQWPAGSRVPRSDRRSTLLLFAHQVLAAAEDSSAEIFARKRLGIAIAAITRMIATTISNSINEKPF